MNSKYLKEILKEATGTACAREETFYTSFKRYINERSPNAGSESHHKEQRRKEQSSQNNRRNYSDSNNRGSNGGRSSNLNDPYTILGCSPDADFDAIRRQYHRLANQYHPDKTKDLPENERKLAETKFKAISAAYEKLKTKFGY